MAHADRPALNMPASPLRCPLSENLEDGFSRLSLNQGVRWDLAFASNENMTCSLSSILKP